ncbi:EamA family transporter [Cellulomonas soli]
MVLAAHPAAPTPLTLLGAALATGGLALVLDLTGTLELDPLGLVFALAAAVGNAAYFALTARPTLLPPVALAGTGMAVGAGAVVLVTAAGVLPFAAPDVHVDLLGASVRWWVPLAVVGVLPTAFGFGISAVSVRLLGERVASFLALTEVVFSVLLAWVLLHERPCRCRWWEPCWSWPVWPRSAAAPRPRCPQRRTRTPRCPRRAPGGGMTSPWVRSADTFRVT